jgi:hypothetical protein
MRWASNPSHQSLEDSYLIVAISVVLRYCWAAPYKYPEFAKLKFHSSPTNQANYTPLSDELSIGVLAASNAGVSWDSASSALASATISSQVSPNSAKAPLLFS